MNYKKDFPIFKTNKNLVYLDSAATTQKPQVVIDSINKFYSLYNSNIHRGLYPLAERTSAEIEEVRQKIKKFINADKDNEIIFTKGTTEGINLLAYSWGREFIKKGDKVVVTIMDHHANFVPWQQLALQKNAIFEVVVMNQEGLIDEKDLLIKTKNARVVSLPFISNVLGSVNSIEYLIKKIRKQNPEIIIVVDAAQALAFVEIDVRKLDCDFLVFSGHKMFSETGVGVLYGKKKILDSMPPFLFGGDMIREVTIKKTTFSELPSKFEAGTLNISGIVSLGAAIDYIYSVGIGKINKHERELASSFAERLRKIDGVSVFGPLVKVSRSNVVSFVIDGVHAHDIAQILAEKNICIRAGHHCTMPLHTYLKIPASARASFSIYSTEVDIDKIITEIKNVKQIFKK